MPMYLRLDPAGVIQDVGPMLAKVLGTDARGNGFEQYFLAVRGWTRNAVAAEVPETQPRPKPDRRNAPARSMRVGEWEVLPGRRLHLGLRDHPEIQLRGVAVPLRMPLGGVFINLTFGIHLADAVRQFSLSDTDFAPSDLAMELLYLQEAKAAVLGELHALNRRLEAARAVALDEAMTDALTGLANRRALDEALERAAKRARGGGAPFAVAHLDLDHFKAVNDTLGHAAGDRVLEQVARTLREETRQGDLVARVGGDEFVLLLRAPFEPAGLVALAQRIVARIQKPIVFNGHDCMVSASVGLALSETFDAASAAQLLTAADAALYEAKHAGRARCALAQRV